MSIQDIYNALAAAPVTSVGGLFCIGLTDQMNLGPQVGALIQALIPSSQTQPQTLYIGGSTQGPTIQPVTQSGGQNTTSVTGTLVVGSALFGPSLNGFQKDNDGKLPTLTSWQVTLTWTNDTDTTVTLIAQPLLSQGATSVTLVTPEPVTLPSEGPLALSFEWVAGDGLSLSQAGSLIGADPDTVTTVQGLSDTIAFANLWLTVNFNLGTLYTEGITLRFDGGATITPDDFSWTFDGIFLELTFPPSPSIQRTSLAIWVEGTVTIGEVALNMSLSLDPDAGLVLNVTGFDSNTLPSLMEAAQQQSYSDTFNNLAANISNGTSSAPTMGSLSIGYSPGNLKGFSFLTIGATIATGGWGDIALAVMVQSFGASPLVAVSAGYGITAINTNAPIETVANSMGQGFNVPSGMTLGGLAITFTKDGDVSEFTMMVNVIGSWQTSPTGLQASDILAYFNWSKSGGTASWEISLGGGLLINKSGPNGSVQPVTVCLLGQLQDAGGSTVGRQDSPEVEAGGPVLTLKAKVEVVPADIGSAGPLADNAPQNVSLPAVQLEDVTVIMTFAPDSFMIFADVELGSSGTVEILGYYGPVTSGATTSNLVLAAKIGFSADIGALIPAIHGAFSLPITIQDLWVVAGNDPNGIDLGALQAAYGGGWPLTLPQVTTRYGSSVVGGPDVLTIGGSQAVGVSGVVATSEVATSGVGAPAATSATAGPSVTLTLQTTFQILNRTCLILDSIQISFIGPAVTFALNGAISFGSGQTVLSELGAGFTYDLSDGTVSFNQPTGYGLRIAAPGSKNGVVGVIEKTPSGMYFGELCIGWGSVGANLLVGFGDLASTGGTEMFGFFAITNNGVVNSSFSITGLALCYGQNMTMNPPPLSQLSSFELLEFIEPGGSGVPAKQDPSTMLNLLVAGTSPPLTVLPGGTLYGGGLTVTLYKALNISALVTVETGPSTQVEVYGLINYTLKVPGQTTPCTVIMVEMEANYNSETGLFQLNGQIDPSSYILSRNSNLNGQFALYIWFAGPDDGDVVMVLGGYGPHLTNLPSQYPQINAPITLNWQVTPSFTFNGDLYMALVPSAVAMGGVWNATWANSKLSAWFTGSIDILFQWSPVWFELDLNVVLGISYTLSVSIFGHTFSTKFSTSIGVSLDITTPPFAFTATVTLSVISFTISSGTQAAEPALLDWPGFCGAFLQAPQGQTSRLEGAPGDTAPAPVLLALGMSDGQLGTVDGGNGGTIYVADPTGFSVTITSQAPLTAGSVTWTGNSGDAVGPTGGWPTAANVGIVSMGASGLDSTLAVTLAANGGGNVEPGTVTATVVKGTVSPAVWGAAGFKGTVLANQPVGLVVELAPTGGATGTVFSTANLFPEVTDATNEPSWSTTATVATDDFDYPSGFAAVADTVNDANTAATRQSIATILAGMGMGIDPDAIDMSAYDTVSGPGPAFLAAPALRLVNEFIPVGATR